jgi:parallel beta-helix repeat protein
MRKATLIPVFILLFAGICIHAYSQFEVKGPGSTGSTSTFISKNNLNDTSLIILDNKNVGIDTSNPQYKLDVNGLINTRVGIRFPDGSVQVKFGGTPYAKVFTVAQSGGDFTTISAAILNCVAPGYANQYLVRVMPGIYSENVKCRKFVHLKGAGKYVTTIKGTVWATDSCVLEDFYIRKGVFCIGTAPTILHNIITNDRTDTTTGIYISNNCSPWIKENEVLDCNGWGIECIDFTTMPWIIGNKILRNNAGGIRCERSSPTISNNIIDHNHLFGIFMIGIMGEPTEPTIDDNVIGHTDYLTVGVGIHMQGLAEPRIIANDIFSNNVGIRVMPSTQPSIMSNNINYNRTNGIWCNSGGATKPVVFQANHINSTAGGVAQAGGIYITPPGTPIISQNVLTANNPDLDFSTCIQGLYPNISLNVFSTMIQPLIPPYVPGLIGNYNVNSAGIPITP